MSYKLFTKFLVLALCLLYSNISFAQDRIISGKVVDEKGEGLPGASILVKDSRMGTMTDIDGNFSLELSEDATAVVISFVGMATREVKIGGSNSLGDITLSSDNSRKIDDVVVVGYGTAKKSDLTGSVSQIKREDLIRDNPTNALQALQGKIAGVNVTQNDGQPGAAMSIKIRGSNSFLGGTEPLYVIDGVPFNNSSSGSTPASIGGDEKQTMNAMSFINPADIENIDILKDASATAIYGSRGANGVVLITTRRGKSGKDKVEFNLTVGMSEVSKRLKMLDAETYASYQNMAFTNANRYSGTNYQLSEFPYPGDSVSGPNGMYYKNGPADFRGRNKNWQDEIFRKALTQNYSINVSGGNETGNHSLSFNYLNQNGAIQNSDYTRFGFNVNLNRNLGKIFKVGTSSSVNRSITNGVKTGTDKSDDANAGVIRSALTYPSAIDTIQSYGQASTSGSQGYFITNPSIYVNDVLNRIKGVNIFSSNYLEANIRPWLKFRQNLGFNYASNNRDQYYPSTVFEGFSVTTTNKGWALKSADQWNSLLSESLLTFDKQYGKHSLNVMGGTTFERTNGQWQSISGQGFSSDELQNESLASAESQLTYNGNRYQSTLISFIGRANYNYDNRYLLTASLRRDGSSKFGADNKWANFPSMAAAWRVSNEAFFSENLKKYWSDFKVRLSYGQTGNQGIGTYASLAKLAVYKYVLGGNLVTGYADDYYSGPANKSLKWETTSSTNAGVDMGFLGNRINLHVDVYRKMTDDLLQYVTTPLSSGYPKKLVNGGSVENKGLEIALDGLAVHTKDFDWNVMANISWNRNKITSLGGADAPKQQFGANISTNDAPFIQTVGQPIGALYGWEEDGYYDNEAEVRNSPWFTNASEAKIKSMVGEIKYKDLDGDGILTNTDRTIIGNVNPDYTFGITNNFRYKNFDLSIFINGVQGNDVVNMNAKYMANIGGPQNITQEMYDGVWTPGADNSNATEPKIVRSFDRETFKFTRRFIEDGSFVRIKNITLGYNINVKNISKIGIQALRVSVGVNNIKTFTKYSGFDPEVNSYGDNPALFGVDLGGYPNIRSYNFSVRCSF